MVLLLAGCVSEAPPLPQDTTGTTSTHLLSPADFTSVDLALSCADIATERTELKAKMDTANANIKANRVNNEVAGYIAGVVFLPALIATEGNYADKDAIKAAYGRQDTLDKLTALKKC